jgi:hypothetical protein
MSDFDDVLERLLTDPVFQARLSADPRGALAGYQLDAHERELLQAQLVGGDGGSHTVEERTNKSGIIGLVGPVVSAFVAGVDHGPMATFGSAPSGSGPQQTFGAAPEGGPVQSFGAAPEGGPVQTFGSAPGTGSGGGVQTFGAAPGSGSSGSAGGVASFGDAPGTGTMGAAPSPALDYHINIDADGDGHWDSYQAYNRPDGGVDILVDTNHDGRVDFIAHDYNRDGIVDSAESDSNYDGVFDTQWYDDNGDGWLDRSEPIPRR